MTTYYVPSTSDPDGHIPAKWFSWSPREVINEFLDQDLDVLIVCLPLNDSTRALIGPEQFQVMKEKQRFVSNIGRGPIIYTDALIYALNTWFISGAALDVTGPEPLLREHPLWDAPNVFITPHVAWWSTDVLARAANIV